MELNSLLKQIQDLYSKNLETHGTKHSAVGWNSPESQMLRFAKLTSVVNTSDAEVSINDYGCGYGAHLDFLQNNVKLKVSKYFGYDLSTEMLRAAQEKHQNFSGTLKLIHSSNLESIADYSFVSGTFNVKFQASDEAWSEFIKSKLHELNTHSLKGFSFNLLTSYVDWKEPHLFYGDPCYWFDYCKKNFSKKVALLHDYPLWEWTIIVRKD